jgi:methionyl-tRNA formyltransferase
MRSHPRIVAFGIRCAFTDVVLDRMCGAGHVADAMILPGPSRLDTPLRRTPVLSALPMAGFAAHAAETSARAVFQVGRLAARETVDLVRDLDPDILLVACFPRRIPEAIRAIPRLAALNVHPSLLPAFRGPDPIFWQLRDGDGRAGVTIHELTGAFDAGPILAQAPYMIQPGASEAAIERDLAVLGAELAASTIDALMSGTATRTAQDESRASYQPWPDDGDYIIDTRRPAAHAFRFLRGVAKRGVPAGIRAGSEVVLVVEALAYVPSGEVPISREVDVRAIAFDPGTVLVRIAGPAAS